MTRGQFVSWLREHVPSEKWEKVWWLTPTIILFLLPVGALILRILGILGWSGAPQATQGLMLFSVICGFVVGSALLWSVREAGLERHALNRALWLARLSVLGPIFILLLMFWIARLT
jgi:hypothetical protein